MTLDLAQLAYYAAFTFLGWWLTKRGLLPGTAPSPGTAPILDQQTLLALLKATLQVQQPPASPAGSSTVFHVPVEVSATPKAVVSNPAPPSHREGAD